MLASEGYPDSPVTGREITGLDALTGDAVVEHAATALVDGRFVATGGRVLSVVGRGATIAEARRVAYDALDDLSLEGGQYRRDIAGAAARS